MRSKEITFALLFFELSLILAQTTIKPETHQILLEEVPSADSENVYEVNEDSKHISFVTPNKNKPTLREIVYYHMAERPYGGSDKNMQKPLLVDFATEIRPFTNSHGHQYVIQKPIEVDISTYDHPYNEDNEKGRDSDVENTSMAPMVTLADDDDKAQEAKDELLKTLKLRRHKLKHNKKHRNNSERAKRSANAMPEAPKLEEINLNDYIFATTESPLEQGDQDDVTAEFVYPIPNDEIKSKINKKIEGIFVTLRPYGDHEEPRHTKLNDDPIENKLYEISSVEEGRPQNIVPRSELKYIPEAKTYGVNLTDDEGYVWNKLVEPPVIYTIGDPDPFVEPTVDIDVDGQHIQVTESPDNDFNIVLNIDKPSKSRDPADKPEKSQAYTEDNDKKGKHESKNGTKTDKNKKPDSEKETDYKKEGEKEKKGDTKNDDGKDNKDDDGEKDKKNDKDNSDDSSKKDKKPNEADKKPDEKENDEKKEKEDNKKEDDKDKKSDDKGNNEEKKKKGNKKEGDKDKKSDDKENDEKKEDNKDKKPDDKENDEKKDNKKEDDKDKKPVEKKETKDNKDQGDKDKKPDDKSEKNGDKLAKHRDEDDKPQKNKHKENNKDKPDDVFDKLQNSDKFWKWLSRWTSSYVGQLTQKVKDIVKKEVERQLKDKQAKPNDKNKTETADSKEKPQNVFGTASGNGKVTNLFIVNPSAGTNEMIKNVLKDTDIGVTKEKDATNNDEKGESGKPKPTREGSPSQKKPTDATPSETKATEATPSEAKPADATKESKPDNSKPTEATSSEQKATDAPIIAKKDESSKTKEDNSKPTKATPSESKLTNASKATEAPSETKPTEVTTNKNETTPNKGKAEATPKEGEAAPKEDKAAPKVAEASPKDAEAGPKEDKAASKEDKAAPKENEAVSKKAKASTENPKAAKPADAAPSEADKNPTPPK